MGLSRNSMPLIVHKMRFYEALRFRAVKSSSFLLSLSRLKYFSVNFHLVLVRKLNHLVRSWSLSLNFFLKMNMSVGALRYLMINVWSAFWADKSPWFNLLFFFESKVKFFKNIWPNYWLEPRFSILEIFHIILSFLRGIS